MKEKMNPLGMSIIMFCLLVAALLASWPRSDAYASPLMVVRTPTRTLTRTPTLIPSITPIPSITLTRTPTLSPTPAPPMCSPVTSTIQAPFVHDGVGAYCWQIAVISQSLISWNTNDLTINGVDFTNQLVLVGNLPPQIGGYWYISYASGPFGHFEVK